MTRVCKRTHNTQTQRETHKMYKQPIVCLSGSSTNSGSCPLLRLLAKSASRASLGANRLYFSLISLQSSTALSSCTTRSMEAGSSEALFVFAGPAFALAVEEPARLILECKQFVRSHVWLSDSRVIHNTVCRIKRRKRCMRSNMQIATHLTQFLCWTRQSSGMDNVEPDDLRIGPQSTVCRI